MSVRDFFADKETLKKEAERQSEEIRNNPDVAESLFIRGFIYFVLEDYKKAVSDLERVVELEPQNVHAHCLKGLSFAKMDQLLKAIQNLNRAIEMEPGFGMAYMCRAIVENARKRYDLAIKDMNKGLKLDPEFAQAYLYRGSAYLGSENFEQAAEDYRMAASFSPALEDIAYDSILLSWLKGGLICVERGEYRLGITYLESYLDKKPATAIICCTLGEAYAKLGDSDQARKYLKSAIDLKPDEATKRRVLENLGKIGMKLE